MSSHEINRNHCTAIHAAILAGEISENTPISDDLMNPFLNAAKAYEEANQHRINPADPESETKVHQDSGRTVMLAAYHTTRAAFSDTCGMEGHDVHQRAHEVQSAVLKGLDARGFKY